MRRSTEPPNRHPSFQSLGWSPILLACARQPAAQREPLPHAVTPAPRLLAAPRRPGDPKPGPASISAKAGRGEASARAPTWACRVVTLRGRRLESLAEGFSTTLMSADHEGGSEPMPRPFCAGGRRRGAQVGTADQSQSRGQPAAAERVRGWGWPTSAVQASSELCPPRKVQDQWTSRGTQCLRPRCSAHQRSGNVHMLSTWPEWRLRSSHAVGKRAGCCVV